MKYEDLMKSLQQKYLVSLPSTIELIERSLKNKDWSCVELEFHKLRGNGTTYGFEEISQMALVTENICRDNEPNKEKLVADAIKLLKDILDHRQHGKVLNLKTNMLFKGLVDKI